MLIKALIKVLVKVFIRVFDKGFDRGIDRGLDRGFDSKWFLYSVFVPHYGMDFSILIIVWNGISPY